MTMQRSFSTGSLLPLEPVEPQSSEPAFDFNAILKLVVLRYRLIIGTTLAVVAITLINVANITPQYDATALVLIDQQKNKVTDPNAVLSAMPIDPITVDNQLQILQSRDLMAQVINTLKLDKSPPQVVPPSFLSRVEFYLKPTNWFGTRVATKPVSSAAQRREDLIEMLLGGEKVGAVEMSSALQIGFRSTSPQQAAQIANAIADAYVQQQVTTKSQATQKTSQWLADRLQQLSSQMQAADAEVQEYKIANNITETASGGSVLDQQLAQLNTQLVTARSDLAEAQAKYAQAKQLQASGRAEDLSQIFQSGLIQQLRTQQSELLRQKAQYLNIFGPKHPKMVELESQLKDIEGKINDEVTRVVATVANDVAVANARVASLQTSMSRLETDSGVQDKAKIKLAELEARSNSAHQLYQAFLEKFKETQGQEGIQTADSRVISRAVPPEAPAIPNKTRDMEMSLVGGLFLGFLLAFAAERFDGRLRTAEQLENLLHLPVLSTIPELKGRKSSQSAADHVIEKPLSTYAEAMRGLELALSHSNIERKPKTILVTSSVPDEGKTTVALSLARVCARGKKKVLLVDCDFRRPSVRKALGLEGARAYARTSAIEERANGLLDVLSGSKPLEDAVITDPQSSVKCLLALRIPTNPTDILSSSAMQRFIKKAGAEWDYVIFDSAPVLPVNDTRILAPFIDTIAFVVRWKKTPKEAVVTAARSLADVNAPVAGIVMTRADLRRQRYYGHGYQSYHKYEKYYTN
jgi:capsular exopolysaccharide synthesis family protein